VVRLAPAAAGLGAGARVRLAAVPEGLPGLVVVPAADEGAAP
jgi:hypothetical protein